MTLIFVHIPKTAGTSFRQSAREKLRCAWDYGLESAETSKVFKDTVYNGRANQLESSLTENRIQFISGHFEASKYRDLIKSNRMITFLRDPANRLVSEYNHHVRHGGYRESLEVYCKNPGHHNRQTRFFSDLNVSDFFFVGITERYSKSLKALNWKSKVNFEELKVNQASNSKRHKLEVSREELGVDLIELIKEKNHQDYLLYSEALQALDNTLNSTDF